MQFERKMLINYKHKYGIHKYIKNIFNNSMYNWNKVYCIRCTKYRNFNTFKISFAFNKTLVLSIIYDKCDCNDNSWIKYALSKIKVSHFSDFMFKGESC